MAEQTTQVGYVGYSGIGYTFCSEVIQNGSGDIQQNKSNITVNFKVMPTGNSAGYYLYGSSSATMVITSNNGFSQSVNITGQKTVMTKNQYVVIGTWSGDVYHKADGTLNITVAVTYGWSSGDAYLPKRTSTTFTTALATIPRASSITATTPQTITNTTGGVSYSVTSASAFYHKLTWQVNSTTAVTETIGLVNATTKNFTVSNDSILAKIPSASTCTLTLTLKTYSDSTYSTQLGSNQTATLTVNVGEQIKPTISIGAIQLYTNGFNGLVLAGRSTVKVESWGVTMVGHATLPTDGVTISGIRVTPTAEHSSSLSGSITSGTLDASPTDYTISFTVTATDSRGHTASLSTADFTVKGYSKPNGTITAYRYSSNSSDRDDTGTNLYLGYTMSVGTALTGNSVSKQTWKININGTDTTLTQNPQTNITLSQDYGATVTLVVKDTVGSTNTITATLAAAVFPIDMYDNGEGTVGVGLGGLAIEGYIKPYLPIIDVEQCFHVTDTGEDLDDYKTTGIYYFDSSHTPTNIPVGVNGWLMVMKSPSSGAVKQMWWRQGTNGTNDYNTYVRQYSASAWSSWVKIITENDSVTLATNANYTGLTNTNPTSGTTYYLIFTNATSGWQPSRANNGLSYYTREGTASQDGFAVLRLGNTTDSGTAGNKYGLLDLYPKTGAFYGRFTTVSTLTANRTYTLPNASGTVLIQAANNFVQLYSGSLTGTNSTTFTYSNYSAYCIVGTPAKYDGSSLDTGVGSVIIPRALITTSDVQWQIGSGTIFSSFKIKYSGTTVTLTKHQGGPVTAVYGIK